MNADYKAALAAARESAFTVGGQAVLRFMAAKRREILEGLAKGPREEAIFAREQVKALDKIMDEVTSERAEGKSPDGAYMT